MTNDSAWNDQAGRGVTVTIKYGKGYEETWAVFRGTVSQVREDIISYFGVDGASVASLTLSELVVNVTNLAHGKGNAAALLGGVVLGSVPSGDTAAAEAAALGTPASDPWASVESNTVTEHPLLARIKAATNVEELKLLWADNQAAFSDENVMAAWKQRGQALQAAAA